MRPIWWRVARPCLVYLGIPYMCILICLAFLQRQMMYVPTHAKTLPVNLAGAPPNGGEDITCQSRDGLQLHGWHLLPAGVTARDQAEFDRHLAHGSQMVVLYFPGNGGHRQYRDADFQLLTRLSLHVVAFDYRGYGENPGTPSEANFAADAHAMWKYLTETRHVAPDRILLFGESLGGGVATRLAAELCQANTPPAGLILSSTFTSMVDAGSYHYPWLPIRLLLIDRYRSDLRIGHVTAPILMLHGARDSIVPLALGQRLFAAAPDKSHGGVPKAFVELPRANHKDILLTDESRFREGLATFLKSLRK